MLWAERCGFDRLGGRAPRLGQIRAEGGRVLRPHDQFSPCVPFTYEMHEQNFKEGRGGEGTGGGPKIVR